MYRYMIPDVFEIPDPLVGKRRAWLPVFVMTAITFGATLGLVVAVNEVPRDDPQVSVSR